MISSTASQQTDLPNPPSATLGLQARMMTRKSFDNSDPTQSLSGVTYVSAVQKPPVF